MASYIYTYNLYAMRLANKADVFPHNTHVIDLVVDSTLNSVASLTPKFLSTIKSAVQSKLAT